MTNAALRGKPDAGNPHVRFDEGEVAPAATPRRGSLLYNAVQTKALLATLATLAAMGGFAATWYVDAENGLDTNGGTSLTDARRTLKGAMSIPGLGDGDTVLALPGVYGDLSEEDASGAQTRCRITKAVTLRSVGGRATRDVTVIRGARDAAPGGLGDGAVRCVSIEAVGAILEGFTLADGATKAGSVDAVDNRGGGLLVLPKATGYAVDCLFSNCVARAGGGMALGVGNNAEGANRAVGAAVRCRFIGCSASAAGAAVREVPSWFCVFDGFDVTPVYSITAPSVNCTFFVGCDDFAGARGPSFNCVAISAKKNYKSYMTNCVVSTELSETYASACIREAYYETLMAPCADDFRPRVTSAAVGAGLFAWLEAHVPEGYRQIDFDGNPVTAAADGSVTCGAIVVPAAPVGGYVTTSDATGSSGCTDFAVNGRPIPASFPLSRFYADTPDATFRLVPFVSGGSVYAVTNATEVFWPGRDGTVEVAVPESGVRRLAVAAASEELFVGKDEAYKTIQDAVTAAKDRAVIRVRPGVYATGGDTVGCASRVAIPAGKGIRLVSTGGADVTVIDGAGAARGLACESTHPVQVDGFTVANGTAQTDATTDDAAHKGGGVYCVRADTVVENCVITNCVAPRGGGVFNGTYRRCRILDCRSSPSHIGSAGTQGNRTGTNGERLALHDTYIDGCWGSYRLFYYWDSVVGCTFGPNNRGVTQGGDGRLFGPRSGTIRDSLFLGPSEENPETPATYSLTLTNCAYLSTCQWATNTVFSDCLPAFAAFDGTADGVPNGSPTNAIATRGIGAFAADWTDTLSDALNAKGRARVALNGADATLGADGSVLLKSGTLPVTVMWKGGCVTVPFSVTGTGVLVVHQDGAPCRVVREGEAASLRLSGEERTAEVSFTYYPGFRDAGGAVLPGLAYQSGVIIVIR